MHKSMLFAKNYLNNNDGSNVASHNKFVLNTVGTIGGSGWSKALIKWHTYNCVCKQSFKGSSDEYAV